MKRERVARRSPDEVSANELTAKCARLRYGLLLQLMECLAEPDALP